MAVDSAFITKKIARIKNTIANSQAMQVELKDLVGMSQTPSEKSSRENELRRQQTITANLKTELQDLERILKSAK